jgi:outer membrane murein-binding lipoprotein Lpp
MWPDVFLDWASALLPIALSIIGVLVSIKVPPSKQLRAWQIGLIAGGLIISGVTFWQQARSRAAHASEVNGLNSQVAALDSKVLSLNSKIDGVKEQQRAETSRREQAERDLATIVQGASKATRDGVVSDMKRSPIKVELSGLPPGGSTLPIHASNITVTSEQRESVRQDAPYCKALIFQSDSPVNTIGIIVSLSAPIKYVKLLEKQLVLQGDSIIDKEEPRKLSVVYRAFGEAVLKPSHPLTVLACAEQDFNVSRAERVDVTSPSQ